jgi:hypothetical protein
MSSLPHRQLRNIFAVEVEKDLGSLPHRQLRNMISTSALERDA